MSTPKTPFAEIDPTALTQVAGGASRSTSSDQVTQMLTQITSSIKDLAASRNDSSDPMQMMLMMMMMMGGFGGGGGSAVVGTAVADHAQPVINVDTSVAGRGGGWGGGGCGWGAKGKGKKGW